MKVSRSRLRTIIREEIKKAIRNEILIEIIGGVSLGTGSSTLAMASGRSGLGSHTDEEEGAESDGRTVLIGDSQIEGELGTRLKSKLSVSDGDVHASTGAAPANWARGSGWSAIETSLATCPARIIVSLGGNGSRGAGALARKLKEKCGDAKIFWSLAPPAVGPRVGELETRRGYNTTIKREVTPHVTRVIDPYEHFENETYECNGCDGVHLSPTAAESYATHVASVV